MRSRTAWPLLIALALATCRGQSPDSTITFELESSGVRCFTSTSRTSDVRPTADGVLVASEGGLLKFDFDGRLKRKWTRTEGMAGHTLREIEVLPNDDVWIASAQGVTRLRRDRLTAYTTLDGLTDARTYSVAADVEGRLFVGTHRGVNLLAGDRFVPFNDTHEFSRRPTYDIHASSDGSLWFAKENALIQYLREGRLRVFQRDPVVPGPRSDIVSNSVRHVITDALGHPWIGTTKGGLGYFDETRWLHVYHRGRYLAEWGLRDNRIAALAMDDEGGLWVGHGDSELAGRHFGVGRLYTNEWTYLTTDNGLPDDRVYRLRDDGNGNLWLATARGAALFSEGGFRVFHSTGELPSNQVIEVRRVRDGQVAVHTAAGEILFDRGHGVDPLSARPAVKAHAPITGRRNTASEPELSPRRDKQVVRVTLRDPDGSLWVGTRGRGLLRWDGTTWTQFLLHGRPLPREITSLCLEDEAGGVLWVGTAAEGALRIDLQAPGSGGA